MANEVENLHLVEMIERIANLVGSQERAGVDDALVREVHLRALHYLARCNRYSNTPSALGAFLGTTKGTVSQSIKVLEDRGLVEKFADAQDGRVMRLRLTRKGRALLVQKAPRGATAEALARGLSAREQRLLHDLLLKSLRGLQQGARGRMFGVCATCRHFARQGLGDQHQCGLTKEPLSQDESGLICREHEFA